MSRAALDWRAGEVVQAKLPNGKTISLCYRPDPKNYAAMHTSFGGGRSATLRAAVSPDTWMDLAACEPPLKDQVETSACTGHAEAYAQEIAHASTGMPLPFHVSPMLAYLFGRAIDRVFVNGAPTSSLTDTGAMPNQVSRACEEYGLLPTQAPDGVSSDAALFAQEGRINEEPRLSDLETAERVVPGKSYVIADCSSGRSLALVEADVKAALSAASWEGIRIKGLPVTFGVWVDTAFMQWDPNGPAQGPCNTNDPNGGGHAIHFCGYRKNTQTGETEYLVRNSWGDWGAVVDTPNGPVDSCIWVTRDFLATCIDLRVIVPDSRDLSI